MYSNLVKIPTVPTINAQITTESLPVSFRSLHINGKEVFSSITNRQFSVRESENTSAILFILDEKNNVIFGTDKFLVTSIQESFSEKVQISETFSEDNPTIFGFGAKTQVINFGITSLDSNTFSKDKTIRGQWAKGFELVWEEKLRASKLVENKHKAVIIIDNEAFFGFPISLTMTKASNNPYTAIFVMSWVLTSKETLIRPDYLDNISSKDKVYIELTAEAYKLFSVVQLLGRLTDQVVFYNGKPVESKNIYKRLYDLKSEIRLNGLKKIRIIEYIDGNYIVHRDIKAFLEEYNLNRITERVQSYVSEFPLIKESVASSLKNMYDTIHSGDTLYKNNQEEYFIYIFSLISDFLKKTFVYQGSVEGIDNTFSEASRYLYWLQAILDILLEASRMVDIQLKDDIIREKSITKEEEKVLIETWGRNK